MNLFKTKKDKKECCTCKPRVMQETMERKDEAGIKILGAGCAKCNALEASVQLALNELGITTPIEHVQDFSEIAAYGVMSTPALVIHGKVCSYGKVLSKEEVLQILNTISFS